MSYSASSDSPPFYFKNPKADKPGINAEIFDAILTKAGFEYQAVVLPTARINLGIKEGTIHIDYTSPEWNALEDFYVITDPYMVFKDYFVFRKGLNPPISTESEVFASKHVIGLIRGYYYRTRELYFVTQDVKDERTLMQMLSRDRINIAILNKYTANYLAKELDVGDLVIGPVHSEAKVSLRVTKSKEHIVPRLNKAIRALKNDNFFEGLFTKYVDISPDTAKL